MGISIIDMALLCEVDVNVELLFEQSVTIMKIYIKCSSIHRACHEASHFVELAGWDLVRNGA